MQIFSQNQKKNYAQMCLIMSKYKVQLEILMEKKIIQKSGKNQENKHMQRYLSYLQHYFITEIRKMKIKVAFFFFVPVLPLRSVPNECAAAEQLAQTHEIKQTMKPYRSEQN